MKWVIFEGGRLIFPCGNESYQMAVIGIVEKYLSNIINSCREVLLQSSGFQEN